MVHECVDEQRLAMPVSLAETVDEDKEMEAASELLNTLYLAKRPCFLVDALIARYNISVLVRKLVDAFQLPVFCTPMGKGIIDEDKPYFQGVYNGQVSYPDVVEHVERVSDLVVELGPLLSDSNTGGHSRNISQHQMVSIEPNQVSILGKGYTGIVMQSCRLATYASQYVADFISSIKVDGEI